MEALKKVIREVPDFPKEGILFYDITTLLKDPQALAQAIDAMTMPYQDKDVDAVAAIEARGYIFGTSIAYRLGKQVPGGQDPAGFPGVPEVDDSIENLRENLRNSIGLDLENSTYQLGAKLEFDPETERFVGNDEANKMLTREYRDPFVVTEVA